MENKIALLDQFGMNYEVQKQELLLPSGKGTGIYGTVRTDNETCFGSFSNKYEIFQNDELMQLALDIENETGYKVNSGTVYRDGAKVALNLRAKDGIVEYNKKVGDVIERGFNITNTFDGTSGLRLAIFHRVLSCTNGMTRKVSEGQANIMHSKNLRQTLEKSLIALKVLKNTEDRMFDNIQRMLNTPVNPIQVEGMIRTLTGLKLADIAADAPKDDSIKGRTIKAAKSMLDCIYDEMGTRENAGHVAKGINVWGLLNGITYYTEHVAGRGAARAESKVFGRLGTTDNRAYDYAVSLIDEAPIYALN